MYLPYQFLLQLSLIKFQAPIDMSIFFNQYDAKDAFFFNDIIAQNNELLTYLVGQFGNDGLFTACSSEGNAIFTKRYHSDAATIRFLNAVPTESSDYMIYGVEKINQSEKIIVLRVTATGTIVWIKRYNVPNTTKFLEIIALGNNNYAFAAQIIENGIQRVAVVKIDGSGTVLSSRKVQTTKNLNIAGIIRSTEGILIYGGTDTDTNNWDNCFIQLDTNLVLKWSKRVGNSDYQIAKHVLQLTGSEVLTTGVHSAANNTFIYRFDSKKTTFTVSILDKTLAGDFLRLAKTETDFLLGRQVTPGTSSTVTRFNSSITPLWHKGLTTDETHQLTDFMLHDTGTERVRVAGKSSSNLSDGLLLRTDTTLTSCKTSSLAIPKISQVQYTSVNLEVTLVNATTNSESINMTLLSDEAQKKEWCPLRVIDLSQETLIQSPYVYLQAAGSDASDDTPKGYHLRWDFRKTLANKHIAKGSLSGSLGSYPATYGFNKNDDFIKIYRTPFQQKYYTDVNFSVQPGVINASGAVREWIYQNISPVGVTGGTAANVVISFPNTAAYDAQALLTNPATSVQNFLKQYTGEIRVQLQGKPCFRFEWRTAFADPGNTTNAQLRYEMVSLYDVSDTSTLKLNERTIFTATQLTSTSVSTCEDIHYVRFDRVNAYTTGIRLYAYIDYLQGTNQAAAWLKIGDYGLTLSDFIAYKRLEDPIKYVIDNHWPKFNDDNGVTGQFKVRVTNYQDRWSNTEGLGYGVSRYLNLSQNSANHTATETVSADPIGNLPDNSTMDISYFDALQLAGLDYHLARMLGFGHIDADKDTTPEFQYLYLMEYDTLGDLEDGEGARFVKHIYMTPHLNIQDYKYPPVPVLTSTPTYGLAIDNGTVNGSLLTDNQGYTPFADMRFVNINRVPFQFEKNFESFFQYTTPFALYEETETISFGMEYALQGSPWKKPELLHDKAYNDNANTPETLLIPNSGENPVYRHQETEEGVHCYALYSVNWFSRPSVESVQVCTDYTKFPKRNTLLPPMNLAVQLVQSEMPPLLTTSQEQVDYAALTGDRTYLRVTFDYNYIHHQAHQFGTTAQFFFNKQEKQIVKGEIISVAPLSNNRIKITTGPYTILSTSPAQTVQPNIAPGMESHFTESLFAVGGMNYRVESVQDTSATAGDNPIFILHKIKETNSVETSLGSNTWITTESYTSPSAGDRFLVAENMGAATNWNNKLAKSVYLESFSTNDFLKISGSTNNDGSYKILNTVYSGTDTVIDVDKVIDDSFTDGSVEYNKVFRVTGFNTSSNGFLISGDVTAHFSGITDLKVFGSLDNDGDYTISSVTFNGTETDLVVNESIFLNSFVSSVGIYKLVSVAGYDTANNQISLSGNYTAELKPSYKEIRQNTDGSTTELVMGGLVASCTITEEPDVYNPDNVPGGSSPGDPVPGSRTGVYTLTFAGNPLPPHIDPEVAWFQGKVRVLEDSSFLPTPLDNRTTARMKELNVQNVYEDSGNLVLIAADPTFQVDQAGIPGSYTPSGEYVPVVTGSSIEVNYHPSYLLYLKVDESQIESGPEQNEFNETTILPAFGEGSRRTFIGTRSVNGWENDPVTDNCASHVGTPAAIVAQEIRDPQPPNPPSGPLYATRPDFYGKSTYTMDVSFTNVPYSVLVYKANERKILDTLYTPDKVQEILEDLALIPAPDLYFTQRWSDLVNVVLEPAGDLHEGEFLDYPNSDFRFPIPNNPDYILPQSFTISPQINPFNGTDAPGSGVTFNIPQLGIVVTMEQAVKEAITGAFISQTKSPMIYAHIVNGERTSNTPAVIRDENDNLIAPGGPGYNAFPYAVKLSGGAIRFCDYNIDGGSNSFYFYYAMELSDRQIKSAPSGIVGPIQLVNTRPAKEPGIKQVLTQIENIAANIPTAVCFKLEEYVASEGIARIDIYRSTNAIDALSIRTMDLAAQIPVNGTIAATDICDTFAELDYPLYGEDLHYRLIALRKITLEDGITTEFIPSEPSKVVRATLVDPNNPKAPCLQSENGTTTASELQQVILKWKQVCYNGTYTLQKMNASGNWQTVYSIKSNDDDMQYPPIVGGSPDFVNFDTTASLDREDENGTPIYHRFRVQVENSSGLFNLSDCQLTLATGCYDLQALSEYVSYTDAHSFNLAEITTQEIDDGSNNNPGTMIFTANIPAVLPAGHNSFTQLEITVKDDLGNSDTKVITTVNGTATFNDGDGGLLLNAPNHSYSITTKLTTDYCTTGFRKVASLSYVHGPCRDLSLIEQIVTITDSSHTYSLTPETTSIDDGVAAPGTLTFTDISNLAGLTNPQMFTQLEITVSDGVGNSDTKSITSSGGTVSFNNGDGGLILNDGTLNRQYTVLLLLKSAECTTGQSYSYNMFYSYSPCNIIQQLTDIISFADNSGASISPATNSQVNSGSNNPGGSITIAEIISGNLPAGHTFDTMDVTLYDGIGGLHTLPVSSGSSATFSTGDGDPGSELDLGAGNPNPTISVQVTLFTGLCTDGSSFVYDFSYTYDPYDDLGDESTIVNFADGNGLILSPLVSGPFNDGTNANPGGSITITDNSSSSLPAGDSFTQMEVTLSDGAAGTYTQNINTVGGNVTFNHGNGLPGEELNLNGNNRTYTIVIKLITVLCPDGVTFVYAGRYTNGI